MEDGSNVIQKQESFCTFTGQAVGTLVVRVDELIGGAGGFGTNTTDPPYEDVIRIWFPAIDRRLSTRSHHLRIFAKDIDSPETVFIIEYYLKNLLARYKGENGGNIPPVKELTDDEFDAHDWARDFVIRKSSIS